MTRYIDNWLVTPSQPRRSYQGNRHMTNEQTHEHADIIIIIMYMVLYHLSIQDRAHGPLQVSIYIYNKPRKYSTGNHNT